MGNSAGPGVVILTTTDLFRVTASTKSALAHAHLYDGAENPGWDTENSPTFNTMVEMPLFNKRYYRADETKHAFYFNWVAGARAQPYDQSWFGGAAAAAYVEHSMCRPTTDIVVLATLDEGSNWVRTGACAAKKRVLETYACRLHQPVCICACGGLEPACICAEKVFSKRISCAGARETLEDALEQVLPKPAEKLQLRIDGDPTAWHSAGKFGKHRLRFVLSEVPHLTLRSELKKQLFDPTALLEQFPELLAVGQALRPSESTSNPVELQLHYRGDVCVSEFPSQRERVAALLLGQGALRPVGRVDCRFSRVRMTKDVPIVIWMGDKRYSIVLEDDSSASS